MKKISFLFIAILVCIGMQARKTNVKIISYNIRYAGAPTDTGAISWESRKEATLRMIRQERPTAIGFQEARPNQTNYVIDNMPEYGHIYAKMDRGEIPAGSSVLILYKKDQCDLLDWGYFWLGEDITKEAKGWDAHNIRPTSWVKLQDKKTKKIFYYCNTHLDHKGQVARIKGVQLLIKKMTEIAGNNATLFIGGDMNCAKDTAYDIEKNGKPINVLEPFYKWMKGGRETAPKTDDHYTFNGFNTTTKHWIDYIFYRNAKAQKWETLIKDYGVPYISDHYPVALTVNF